METSKQRTERLMAMTHAQLMMHCQDLTAERDKLKAALEEIKRWTGTFCAKDHPIITFADEALKESA